jgi:GTPase SAR1 family protein
MMITRKATTLREALKVLTPKPLETPEELKDFYSSEPNQVRGDDKIARIKLGLSLADMDNPFKAFLIGHPGSGKSTELSRLINEMQGQYRFVRFDLRDELDPVNFKPFDVLLLMMIKLVEQTSLPIAEGGAGYQPSDDLLENIWNWYHNKTVTLTRKRTGSLTAEAGIEKPKIPWWPKIVELIASIKGEIKLVADR